MKLEAAKRQVERYKKTLHRMPKNKFESPSPRKKVKQLLKGRKVAKDIQKRLVNCECFNKQLKCNADAVTSQRQKQIFTRAVSGSILKKYRMLSKAKGYCPWWRYNSVHTKNKSRRLESYVRQERLGSERHEQGKLVVSFLENDANSQMCPGKKDCISKRGEKRQKRVLCDSLRNLHIKFCHLHGTDMLYSTFCHLRPFWVMELHMDRQSCVLVMRIWVF